MTIRPLMGRSHAASEPGRTHRRRIWDLGSVHIRFLGPERVWESSQRLTPRGSIGDVNEEPSYENGRSLHKVSESPDLDM